MFKPTLLACLLAVPFAVAAQVAPLSHQAEPGVYRLVAENDQFRVIEATWKPGQRDAVHSHSAAAVYRLTDCKARLYDGNGKVQGEAESKAGSASLQGAIEAHSFENIGAADCRILLVERK